MSQWYEECSNGQPYFYANLVQHLKGTAITRDDVYGTITINTSGTTDEIYAKLKTILTTSTPSNLEWSFNDENKTVDLKFIGGGDSSFIKAVENIFNVDADGKLTLLIDATLQKTGNKLGVATEVTDNIDKNANAIGVTETNVAKLGDITGILANSSDPEKTLAAQTKDLDTKIKNKVSGITFAGQPDTKTVNISDDFIAVVDGTDPSISELKLAKPEQADLKLNQIVSYTKTIVFKEGDTDFNVTRADFLTFVKEFAPDTTDATLDNTLIAGITNVNDPLNIRLDLNIGGVRMYSTELRDSLVRPDTSTISMSGDINVGVTNFRESVRLELNPTIFKVQYYSSASIPIVAGDSVSLTIGVPNPNYLSVEGGGKTVTKINKIIYNNVKSVVQTGDNEVTVTNENANLSEAVDNETTYLDENGKIAVVANVFDEAHFRRTPGLTERIWRLIGTIDKGSPFVGTDGILGQFEFSAHNWVNAVLRITGNSENAITIAEIPTKSVIVNYADDFKNIDNADPIAFNIMKEGQEIVLGAGTPQEKTIDIGGRLAIWLLDEVNDVMTTKGFNGVINGNAISHDNFELMAIPKTPKSDEFTLNEFQDPDKLVIDVSTFLIPGQRFAAEVNNIAFVDDEGNKFKPTSVRGGADVSIVNNDANVPGEALISSTGGSGGGGISIDGKAVNKLDHDETIIYDVKTDLKEAITKVNPDLPLTSLTVKDKVVINGVTIHKGDVNVEAS